MPAVFPCWKADGIWRHTGDAVLRVRPMRSRGCPYCGVKTPVILCHQDSYRIGLGENHSDVYNWFNRFGKTMDDVRNDVAALLAGAENREEEDDMTKADVIKIIQEYEAEKAKLEPSDWSKNDRAWAESNGIIAGTDNGMQYKSNCTREQVVTLLHRLAQMLGKG